MTGTRSRLLRTFARAVPLLLLCSALRAQTPTPAPKIQVAVNSVIVPVVVTDAQGGTLGDLKQQDFEILDEGKPRNIAGFSIRRHVPTVNTTPAVPAAPRSPASPAPKRAETSPRRFLVFLFDDLHLNAGDLMQVQKAGSAMVRDALKPADVAAVVSISGSNSGLTADPVALQQAISKLHMHNLYRQAVHECPDIDYYHADLIENKHDGPALESAIADALNCGHLDIREVAERMVHSAASRTLALGDQDVRVSLGMVHEMVRRMGALPGERTVILVSPGFLTITGEALSEKSRIMDLAAQTNVIISALDARGLYSAQIGADERGASTAMDLITGSPTQSRQDTMSLSRNVMAELAAASGGTYFHDNNDLRAGFAVLAAAPEIVYLLEFSLDGVKLDGRYHRLSVKVDQPHGHVQARPGYLAAKPAKAANK